MPAVLALLMVGGVAAPAQADTVFSQQWHLDAMKAKEMWRTSTGEGVTVGLVDTRVREVPELAGQLLPGKNFARAEAEEQNEHGTTTAALIVGTGKRADGGEGAFGLAPGAKVLPLVIPDGQGAGSTAERDRAVSRGMAPAIRYAADSEAKIISVSFGVTKADASVREAVEYARSKGKLIFAAVGDSSTDEPPVKYPAADIGVVGVTGIDKNVKAIKKAGIGITVDFSAPGEDVISACADRAGLCRNRGTAVATALASASAALIWAKHPEWTAEQVVRVLVNTAGGPSSGAMRNDYIGFGAVRPRIALKTPGEPGPADRDPIPDYRTASPTPSGPSPTKKEPDKAGADAVAAAMDGGHSGPFWAALAVCAFGVLCVGVTGPLLLADRRRMRLNRP
ncbi:S8 family serine peptidase [Streptomyces sp. NPDC002540]